MISFILILIHIIIIIIMIVIIIIICLLDWRRVVAPSKLDGEGRLEGVPGYSVFLGREVVESSW